MARKQKRCTCSEFSFVHDGATHTTKCDRWTGREFAQGHDARLKGFLIQAGTLELQVRRTQTDNDGKPSKAVDRDALAHADAFGFGYMVREAVSRHQAKLAEKADAKPAKAKAARKPATPRKAAKGASTRPAGRKAAGSQEKAVSGASPQPAGVREETVRLIKAGGARGRQYRAIIREDGTALVKTGKAHKIAAEGEYEIAIR